MRRGWQQKVTRLAIAYSHQDWAKIDHLIGQFAPDLPSVAPNAADGSQWQAKAFHFISRYQAMDWNACERMIQWWRRDPHFVNSYSYMEARVLTYGEDPAGAPQWH